MTTRNQNMLHIGMSLAPTWLTETERKVRESRGFSLEDDIEICRLAEDAKLDYVFLPDTLFVDPKQNIRRSGALDPTMRLAALTQHTSRIGLLTTVSTTFFPPYIVARQLQSLHWLSRGRAGWNIVTALDGHRNFGFDEMPPADEKYARAEEFVEVVKQLWASNPAGDASAETLHSIDFKGTYLQVQGPLNLRAPEGDRIALIQAGASDTGRDFASRVADGIFASTPDKQAAIDLRSDLRSRAIRHGRTADDVQIMPGLNCILAPTRAEAHDIFMDTQKSVDRRQRLAGIHRMIGLDLTDWPDDKPITSDDVPPLPAKLRSRTHSELLRRLILREHPTLAELLRRPESAGSGHWRIIGTVDEAAQQILQWHRDGAIDGFINVPGGGTASMKLTLTELIPQLVDMGLFRSDYSSNSFLGHLAQRDV